MNLHEELDRLILFHRWTKWAHRTYPPPRDIIDVLTNSVKLGYLRARLTRIKPMFHERNEPMKAEMMR